MANNPPSSPVAPKSTPWKDLPRRFLTIGIGVPLIALQLRYYVTSLLFFQAAHIICLLEWKNLVLSCVIDVKKSDDVSSSRAASTEGSTKTLWQKLLSILLDDQWRSLSELERSQFYMFCFFSIIITVISTSGIPVTLMFAGICLRMVQYIPTFPSTAPSQPIHAIQHYQFGLVYISVGFHYLLQICRDGGPRHIGYMIFIVWMSDTGALILGRLLKTKTNINNTSANWYQRQGIFPSFLKAISPGKTIPGLVGALLTGPISAVLYPIDLSANTLQIPIISDDPIIQKMVLGFVLATVGIIGDLAESSVKRMSGKKDSGGLLPGHGGVVDRFDSLFTAGIVYYCWVLG